MATVVFPCTTRLIFFPVYLPNSYFLPAYVPTIPLASTNKPPHCFFTHIIKFSELLNMFIINRLSYLLSNFREFFDHDDRPNYFFSPIFLAFSVVPRESYLLKTLYNVVFCIFNILTTCPYEWPPLTNSTMQSFWPTDKS